MASSLEDGPMVQMIFARRKLAGHAGAANGSAIGFSRETPPAPLRYSSPELTPQALATPIPVNSLPKSERGKSMALNSAPIRITSEIKYIHTKSAIATPSDP